MAKIKIIRDTFSDESTIGKLYIDGEYFCETLEDKDRFLEAGGKKEYSKTAIPRGVYSVVLNESVRFKSLCRFYLTCLNLKAYVFIVGTKQMIQTDVYLSGGQEEETL